MIDHYLQLLQRYLFPIFCVGCQREGDWLCAECLESLPTINATAAQVAEVDGLTVRGSYHEWVWGDLLHAWKYNGAADVAPQLVSWFQEIAPFLPEPATPPLIIPVPLAQRRLRDRGFNQAAVLGKGLADTLNWPLAEVLERTRETNVQANLNRLARQENVRDCFRCIDVSVVRGHTCYLVDDVVTTGATTAEAVRVLKQAGASAVFIVALLHSHSDLSTR